MPTADQPPASRRRQLIGLAITVLVLIGAVILDRAEIGTARGSITVDACAVDGSQTEEEEAAALALCDREGSR